MAAADSSGMDPLLRERASKIRLLALDVDGVLTDGKLYYDQAGNEMKAFLTRDGLGMRALLRFGIRLAIITGRSSPMVDRRAKELGVEFIYQGQSDKLSAYHRLLNDAGVEADQVCYVGDDWVDLPVLNRVGLSVTVADADSLVRDRVHWITQLGGGAGAVREVCDLILQAQELDKVLLKELGNP